MRNIKAEDITRVVAAAAIKANTLLPPDIYQALSKSKEKESLPRASKSWRCCWRMLTWLEKKE